jgi:hypothetical protein
MLPYENHTGAPTCCSQAWTSRSSTQFQKLAFYERHERTLRKLHKASDH